MKKVYSKPDRSLSLFKNTFTRFALLFAMLMIFNVFEGLGQTYTWIGGNSTWTTATNWSPTRTVPSTSDILQFNDGTTVTVNAVPIQTIGQLLVSASTTVNLQSGAAANVLTIGGAAGTDLSVASGSALNITGANVMLITLATGATGSITGNMAFSNNAHKLDAADAGGITFNSPAVFTQGASCTGNVFTAAGTSNAIVFNTGSTLIQTVGANPFGFPAPNSKVVFNTGSLFKFQQNAAPSFSGRTYANLEINFASFNQSAVGVSLLTVDNLTITLGILNLNLTTAGINIKGNISVAAGQTLTFTPLVASTLVLNGTSAQSITNSGTLTFSANESLTINNANGITLNSNITLNSLVTFTSGVITITNPTKITLSATGSVAGVSNASFVDGMVSKIGNTAFTFPVGKSNCGPSGAVKGYAALAIANFTGGAVTDQFTAEYKRGDALALGSISALGLDHISKCDYWTFTRDNGVSTVDITLSWDATINNCNALALYVNNPLSLTVAHNNNTGASTWDAYGVAGQTTGGNAAGTVSWSVIQSSTFGAFVIGSIDFLNPLPITLNYLNGIRQGSTDLLNWSVTCNKTPTATLNLERSSDARNFGSIYSITATALRCQQPFDYTDVQPLNGMNYYRLNMMDADAKITYSNIIALLNATRGFELISIAPNPVIGNTFKLNATAATPTKMEMVISDMEGRILSRQTISLIAGYNSIDMNISNLAAGTYNIYGTTADNRSRVIRFVKQ